MRFYPAMEPARPDWDRARQLVAQIEYERDTREREREVEHVGGEWSPAHVCRRRAA